MFETCSRTCQLAFKRSGLDWGSYWGSSMSAKDQFAALEVMSRERAALAKKEMEYWLAESEEWKQLGQSSDPFAERRITRTEGYPGSNGSRRYGTTERNAIIPELIGCSRYSMLLRGDLFNRYTAKNWNAAMTRGPIDFPRSCCNNPTPASSN